MGGGTLAGGAVAGGTLVGGAAVVAAPMVVGGAVVVSVVVVGTLVGGTLSSGTVLLTEVDERVVDGLELGVVVDDASLDDGGAPATTRSMVGGSAVADEVGSVTATLFGSSGADVEVGGVSVPVETDGEGGGADPAATLEPETPERANTVDVDATICALAAVMTIGVAFAVIHAGWCEASVATMDMSAEVDRPPATMQPASAGRRRGARTAGAARRAASRASRSA